MRLFATISCAVALGVLIRAELRRDGTHRALAKLVASLSFLAVGWLGAGGTAFDVSMVLGLAFGVCGDLALLAEDGFVAGLALFLIGHLLYVAAMIGHAAHLASLPALLPIACSALALRWLWPRLGRLRVPVIAYVAVMTAMVVTAQGVGYLRLTAGAWLFYASDLCVARDRFVARGIANKLVGLPLYYAGQLLIAWSI